MRSNDIATSAGLINKRSGTSKAIGG